MHLMEQSASWANTTLHDAVELTRSVRCEGSEMPHWAAEGQMTATKVVCQYVCSKSEISIQTTDSEHNVFCKLPGWRRSSFEGWYKSNELI